MYRWILNTMAIILKFVDTRLPTYNTNLEIDKDTLGLVSPGVLLYIVCKKNNSKTMMVE